MSPAITKRAGDSIAHNAEVQASGVGENMKLEAA